MTTLPLPVDAATTADDAGRTPTWTREQIDAWQATRPGQGARTDLRQ